MLKKPVVTEIRTPTNTWSGLGFSKSMPAESIKELRRAHHVPYKPSISTTYEVQTHRCSINLVQYIWSCSLQKWFEKAGFQSCFLCIWFQNSHLSVSHSGSQEGLGNDTKSGNWGDLNGNININGNGLPGNSEFSPAVSSPKRIKNKSCKTKDFALRNTKQYIYCQLISCVLNFIRVFGSVGEQYLSSSNYMDSISMSGSNGCSLSSSLKGTDLPELFSKLGLGKYTDIFQQQEVIH